ncbi:carbohydrate ABC transporter permease [Devosia ginsengisoli]|uniref:carbohydrate ABC transporter permease n=1 Tax=Devosia ginsengisoli TaxID=400770 RepID=UPI0034E93F79
MDTELYESAEVDGANAVQRFRYVTLPGMRYVILVVLLLSFISTFNQFGLIFLMTGGGPVGRHAPLFDPRLREGDRLAAIRPGFGDCAVRRAADGLPHLPAEQVYAA